MGCTGSKRGSCCCCAARRKKKVKTQYEKKQASCELIAENVNTTNLHEAAKKCEIELLEKHTNKITTLQQQQQEEFLKEADLTEAKRLSQDVKIQEENDKNLEFMQELSEKYNLLKRKVDERLGEPQKVHDEETRFLAESYEMSKSSLQETIDKLSSQMKSFEDKMKRVEESVLSRDYRKHIQDHGSPSPFWEQEVESLHFVIEMKNERIHHLDKKLFYLETVMEQNLLLEEKVKTLQQENEELHVRMQNHITVTRQLSDEVLKLREALEKESQLKEQARQEKEELLYRVLNDDPAQIFPISTEVTFIAT
nr:coiled-coil domain-containing protein 69 isoform X1 [Anolis sagrei ordinatus]